MHCTLLSLHSRLTIWYAMIRLDLTWYIFALPSHRHTAHYTHIHTCGTIRYLPDVNVINCLAISPHAIDTVPAQPTYNNRVSISISMSLYHLQAHIPFIFFMLLIKSTTVYEMKYIFLFTFVLFELVIYIYIYIYCIIGILLFCFGIYLSSPSHLVLFLFLSYDQGWWRWWPLMSQLLVWL